jgi:ketosteroid isomerase-like protein
MGADGEDTAVVSSENVELGRRIAERVAADDFVAVLRDDATFEATMSELRPFAVPDFEVEMLAPEYAATEPLVHRGAEGYATVLREWLAPYESFRAEIEEYLDAGDTVVVLVKQVALTTGASVPMEVESAVNMTFREGKMTRIEFHLDRDRALKAAGVSE